jgi:hypothetical protein
MIHSKKVLRALYNGYQAKQEKQVGAFVAPTSPKSNTSKKAGKPMDIKAIVQKHCASLRSGVKPEVMITNCLSDFLESVILNVRDEAIKDSLLSDKEALKALISQNPTIRQLQNQLHYIETGERLPFNNPIPLTGVGRFETLNS